MGIWRSLFGEEPDQSEDARRKGQIKRLDKVLGDYRLGKISKKQLQDKIEKERRDKYK